jgi:translation elongation factor EF-4
MSLILSTTSGKSHLIHLIDTPGHVNFVDEVASAIRLVDGILVVVDVVEGVRCYLRIDNLQYLTTRACSLWLAQNLSSAMPFKRVLKLH